MVSEKNVVSRIFGRKDDVTRGRRKFHNKELLNLYALQSTIRMLKLRRMR
jgi:hypothetical protein